MDISLSLINGLALGLEFVEANKEAGIDNSCIILDLLVFRFIAEITG